MLLSIARKNIWRNKLRSLIVILAITVGLFGGLYGSALMIGMTDQRIKLAIANEISNIQIHHKDFILNKNLNDTIYDTQKLIAVLDTIHAIKAYSCRLKLVGMVTSASIGCGVLINGIDPVKEQTVTSLNKCIPDSMGNWFKENRRNQVLIGKILMEKLKIKLRSKIVVKFQDCYGNIATAAFKVSGVYKTANSSFDETNIFVALDDLNPLVGFEGQRFHETNIALKTDESNSRVVRMLQSSFPDLNIMGWKEIMPDLGMMNDMMLMWLYIIMVIILLALSFGIINTMMMSVLERTREIGMLMVLGMKRTRVFFMIMMESVMLSLTGGAAGMTISGLIITYTSKHGVDLSNFGKGMEEIGFSAIVYPMLGFDFYIALTILVIITGIASCIMPARRALKLKPVEAIRII